MDEERTSRSLTASEVAQLAAEIKDRMGQATSETIEARAARLKVGPDVPLTETPSGLGRQSDVSYRFDLMDPAAMFALASVLDYGQRRGYAVDNWRYIPVADNINHALVHLYAHLAGDKQDNHLAHAFTRLMFALGVELQGGPRDQPNA